MSSDYTGAGTPRNLKTCTAGSWGFPSRTMSTVKIHAHYPGIKVDPNDDKRINVTYHSWLVKEFQWITDQDKWRAYKFVMAVYTIWVPDHVARLKMAMSGLEQWDDIHNNMIDEQRFNVREVGTTSPAKQDPNVPDVDSAF
ncbi:hypothetical protein BDW71DRAFT_183250 [Aspergillus fruticulosus]